MKFALETLTEKLKATGMNQYEINYLLAKFLEEEAFDYVDYIYSCLDGIDADTNASGLIC